MKKNLIITLVLLGLSAFAVARFSSLGEKAAPAEADPRKKAAKILAEMNRYYQEHPYFSADVEQLAYRDHLSDDQPETMTGHITAWKNGKASVMMGVQTLEDEQYSITIDTAEAVIMLADRLVQPKLPDLEELERNLQHALHVDIRENGAYTDIVMQFEPTKYPLQQMQVRLHQNRIALLQMWHAQEVAFEDGSVSRPRIEVRFSNYKEGKKVVRKTAALRDYISTGTPAKIVHPAFRSFQLIDLRIKK